jgi:hypothetical protein
MVDRLELPELALRACDRMQSLVVPKISASTAKDLIVQTHGDVVVVCKVREHITVQCPLGGRMKQNSCPGILNNIVDFAY